MQNTITPVTKQKHTLVTHYFIITLSLCAVRLQCNVIKLVLFMGSLTHQLIVSAAHNHDEKLPGIREADQSGGTDATSRLILDQLGSVWISTLRTRKCYKTGAVHHIRKRYQIIRNQNLVFFPLFFSLCLFACTLLSMALESSSGFTV